MILTYSAPVAAIDVFTCELGTPQIRTYSGGYLAAASMIWGAPTPVPAGTIFAPYCSVFDKRGAIADGLGGTADGLVSSNSPECGYTAPPPPVGTVYPTYCTGLDLWGDVFDGISTWTPTRLSIQSNTCGSNISAMRAPWTPIVDISGALRIDLDSNSGTLVITGTPLFHNQNTGEDPASFTVISTSIYLTYTTPPTVGDQITFMPAGASVLTQWNQQPWDITQIAQ